MAVRPRSFEDKAESPGESFEIPEGPCYRFNVSAATY